SLARVTEDDADHGQGGGHDHRTGCAQQGTEDDHEHRAVRDQDENRNQAENRKTDQEGVLTTPPVGDRAHGDEQAGQEQCVDVDDQQLLGGGSTEFGDEGGKGYDEDGHVHHHHHQAAGEDDQRGPALPVGHGPHCHGS